MRILNLFEGLSPVLYHTTKFKNALDILEHDKFMLSIDNNSREADLNSGKLQYWLSTARSMYNAFSDGISQGVVFVLDGRKLSNNLTGKPVSYFSKSNSLRGTDYNEMEDRIYSDNRFIERASKFILKIIIKSEIGLVSQQEMELLKRIASVANNRGLTVEYRIGGKISDIADLKIGGDAKPDSMIDDDHGDISEIVDAIIGILSGKIYRFSELKQKYPSSVPYLIGATPDEFLSRFRNLLNKARHNPSIDPLIHMIKKSYNRDLRKFASDLFHKTNSI